MGHSLKYNQQLIFVVLLLLFFTSCSLTDKQRPATECINVRAAFDIGSSTTKFKVARINTCRKKILEYLYEEDIYINFKADLKQSKIHNLSAKIMQSALTNVDRLVKKARALGAKTILAVATASSRNAKNGQLLIDRIKRETAVEIVIITQELEAHIGFEAAMAWGSLDRNKTIVWDIGGGSMQMTMRRDDQYYTYKSKLASISFKEYVMENILGQKVTAAHSSPNPIVYDKLLQATKFVKDSKKLIPQALLKEFKIKHTKIVGIGGVHYYSIRHQINNKRLDYTRDELAQTLKKRSGLKDSQISSKYRATEITNLSLVLGYMQALHIDHVTTVKINLCDGLLVLGANYLQAQ